MLKINQILYESIMIQFYAYVKCITYVRLYRFIKKCLSLSLILHYKEI